MAPLVAVGAPVVAVRGGPSVQVVHRSRSRPRLRHAPRKVRPSRRLDERADSASETGPEPAGAPDGAGRAPDRHSATAPLGEQRTLEAATTPATAGAATDRLPSVPRDAYTVWEEVGQGGIGRVLRARDQRLGRPVAIKELLVWNADQEQRFVREALLTARLQHPAIVPVYEAGRWPAGTPFYAMKLLSGRSLADLIARCRQFSERLALLPHVITAAQAVAYAHSRRIIHRDLKPANILVGEFGETVVIDWGLAKDLAEKDDPPARHAAHAAEGLTMQGAVMGTPAYMPPEQAAGAVVDERADVYALGAVLYHMLAAAPPYDEVTWERLLDRIAEAPPRRLEAIVPQVSDELAAIVHKAMARDPADRYRTAEDMADDLERLQAGQIVAAHTYSAAHLLRRFWRRHHTALSITAAALVLITVVVIAAFLETDQARLFAEDKEREAVEASQAADTARLAAERASRQATARADDLTLLQAHDALRRDPNRALAWLMTLSPEFADVARVRRIAADAQARGLSRAFVGHTTYISRFSVDPGGARFVTASDDKTARIWDLATGESLALVGHTDEVWNAQFSADGRTVATAGKDGTLRLWDAATGALQSTIPVPAGTRQLVTRPDGAIIGARTTTGAAWIVRPGAAPELLTPAAEHPRVAHASADGRRVIAQPEHAEAYVLDLDRNTRRRLPGTRGAPGRWFLDRHGERAVHLTDETAAVWDLATMVRRDLGLASTSRRPAFSPRGDRLALAADADIHVFDARTGAPQRRFAGHDGPVEVLEFAADGRTLVSGGVDRTVRTWDLASGRSEVHAGLEGIVTEVLPLADARSILAVSTAGEARLFEPHRAGRILTEHAAEATGLALSADDRVASIDAQGRLRISDLTGRAIAEHRTPAAHGLVLAAAPDGRRFAAAPRAWVVRTDGRYPDRDAPPAVLVLGTFDAHPPLRVPLPSAVLDLAWAADVVVVALRDGAVLGIDPAGAITELDRFTTAATSLAVAQDAAWIAAGAEDGSLRLSERATARRRDLAPHKERLTGLAFAPGHAWFASGCADHTVRVYRLSDGTYRSFDEGGHGMEQVGFSADGRVLILLSGGETELRRLDVATGTHLTPLAGPVGKLLGFTLSADGRRILTHGADGAVRVIDLADGEGRTLAGHSEPVTGAGFAADGRVIVTLGREGTVRAWPDDLPETMTELRAWIAGQATGQLR